MQVVQKWKLADLWNVKIGRRNLRAVGGDVRRGEQTPAMADLTVPPVLVRAVRHRYHIAPFELQFALFLRREIVQGLD